jgi:hypothetical protein
MSDKTFKQRVLEEAKAFAEIYEHFREDLEAWRNENGPMDNDWDHLFAVPLNGAEAKEPADRKAARLEWKVPHKHDAVREAVDQLGDLMRVGPIVINDQRTSTALEMGLLTPNDIAPSPKEGFVGVERLARRLKPEYDDPIFWRALLEILCRAFTASKGRPPWPVNKLIVLAFDLDAIRRDDPNKSWTISDFQKVLGTNKKYLNFCPKNASAADQVGVGEELIKRIVKLIGPMDDGALGRLKKLFPKEFDEGFDQYLRRGTLEDSEDHLATLLDMAENVNDALEGSRKAGSDTSS